MEESGGGAKFKGSNLNAANGNQPCSIRLDRNQMYIVLRGKVKIERCATLDGSFTFMNSIVRGDREGQESGMAAQDDSKEEQDGLTKRSIGEPTGRTPLSNNKTDKRDASALSPQQHSARRRSPNPKSNDVISDGSLSPE